MNVQEENNCFNCRFFTKAIGEKGYCILYHHETSLPEKPCPRHEKEQIDESKNIQRPEDVDYKSRRIKKNLFIGSALASLVLSGFAVFVLIVFGVNVITHEELSVLMKSFTLLVAISFVFVTIFSLFYFGRKSERLRTIEILLAFFVCVISLISFNSIISTTNGFVEALVEGIISVV